MIAYLKYRYAKTRMAAFVDGELPSASRRIIARLIDEDQRVYREYVRHRQVSRELEHQLPGFGRPLGTQLDAMWSHIQEQINPESNNAISKMSAGRSKSLKHVFAVFLTGLTLLSPSLFQAGTMTASEIQFVRARPEETASVTAPANSMLQPRATSVALLVLTESQRINDPDRYLQNTPEPHGSG